MKTVAILTPAYNRCDLLDRLYISLKNQTDKDFIWVVIDDGSTDGTEEYFSSIEKSSDFQIVYHKKENGSDNYLDIIQNISRDFTNMKLMRD